MVTLHKFSDRNQWLDWRAGKFGASSAAAVCGKGKFYPRNQVEMLSQELTGKASYVNDAMKSGLDLEKDVLEYAVKQINVPCLKLETGVCLWDEETNLMASLDGYDGRPRDFYSGGILVECKVIRDAKYKKDINRVYETYKWQLQQQLMLATLHHDPAINLCNVGHYLVVFFTDKDGNVLKRDFIRIQQDEILQGEILDSWATYRKLRGLVKKDREAVEQFLDRNQIYDVKFDAAAAEYARLKEVSNEINKKITSLKEELTSFLPFDVNAVENSVVSISRVYTKTSPLNDLQEYFDSTYELVSKVLFNDSEKVKRLAALINAPPQKESVRVTIKKS